MSEPVAEFGGVGVYRRPTVAPDASLQPNERFFCAPTYKFLPANLNGDIVDVNVQENRRVFALCLQTGDEASKVAAVAALRGSFAGDPRVEEITTSKVFCTLESAFVNLPDLPASLELVRQNISPAAGGGCLLVQLRGPDNMEIEALKQILRPLVLEATATLTGGIVLAAVTVPLASLCDTTNHPAAAAAPVTVPLSPMIMLTRGQAGSPANHNIMVNWQSSLPVEHHLFERLADNTGFRIRTPGCYLLGYSLVFTTFSHGWLWLSSGRRLASFGAHGAVSGCITGSSPIHITEPTVVQLILANGALDMNAADPRTLWGVKIA